MCDSEEMFYKACRAASILGTLQAGYTDFKFLSDASKKIFDREALLGVSVTGWMNNPKTLFDEKILQRGAEIVKETNREVAGLLGINPAARTTCVKPAGSTSCVLGTASGIHPHHSGRYFRRVQTNRNEAPANYFQAHNPRAVEKSLWNPNGTDLVITFCVQTPEGALTKREVSAVELLKRVKTTQNNWVAAGKRPERCAASFVDHNVSNTINVGANEWRDVAEYIYENRASFAGISLLPAGGDLDYKQAPMCDVWTSEEIVKHYGTGALLASGLIVDGLRAFNEDLWLGCDVTLGIAKINPISLPSSPDATALESFKKDSKKYIEQQDWVRRAKKFATNYFGGNIREMTYCLKRVHNCKLWEDLTRE